jgi:hypothetical protein
MVAMKLGDEQERKWKEFTSTLVGSAFARYERLRDEAWKRDAQLLYTGVGHNTAKAAWERADEAREQLLVFLKDPWQLFSHEQLQRLYPVLLSSKRDTIARKMSEEIEAELRRRDEEE